MLLFKFIPVCFNRHSLATGYLYFILLHIEAINATENVLNNTAVSIKFKQKPAYNGGSKNA